MNPVSPSLSQHDHRVLIQALDLAHIEPHSPGVVFWHPAGLRVMRRLEDYSRRLHEAEQYQEVRSPQLLSQELWERSGHWAKYREGMFAVQSDDGGRPMALKPMSCPGHIALYANRRRGHHELPVRLFEFGAVHRNEPSGALSGFLRLRGFVQDDAHVFARGDALEGVVAGFVRMVERAYPEFGFSSWRYRLALRPAQRAGSEEDWDRAEAALRSACRALGLAAEEAPGEGAFYGPKLEVVLEDRLGRSWQCGVIQVDFVLPQRFELGYADEKGENAVPVLLHHAVFGSLERWLAIVLEQHGGLPDGLAPAPVAVFPVAASSEGAARRLYDDLRQAGVPAAWSCEGPLNGRLRDAAQAHVPYWAVVGPREAEAGQVQLRRRGEKQGRCLDIGPWVASAAAAWKSGHPQAAGFGGEA